MLIGLSNDNRFTFPKLNIDTGERGKRKNDVEIFFMLKPDNVPRYFEHDCLRRNSSGKLVYAHEWPCNIYQSKAFKR